MNCWHCSERAGTRRRASGDDDVRGEWRVSGPRLEGGVGSGLELIATVIGFFEGIAVLGGDVAEVARGVGGMAEALVVASLFVPKGEGIAFGLGIVRRDHVVRGVVTFVITILIPGATGVVVVRGMLGASVV